MLAMLSEYRQGQGGDHRPDAGGEVMHLPDNGVKPRHGAKHGPDIYDCTDDMPIAIGESVTDEAGYTWQYISRGRRAGAVTGGVYHTFESANGWQWEGVFLESIEKRFPSIRQA